MSIIEQQEQEHPIGLLEAVTTPDEVVKLQTAAKSVFVDRLGRQYIVTLVEATRQHQAISLGASPRASLGLFRAARGLALVQDRDFVLPDDIKALAVPVMAHRIILSSSARMRGVAQPEVVSELLESVAVPGATR